MNCPQCGAALSGDKCEYCGTVVHQPAVNPAPTPPPPPPQYQQYPPQSQNGPGYEPPRQWRSPASRKNKIVAFILCLFFGYFGAHYFYVGKSGLGVLYIFTAGLFGIGWVVDWFRILSGNFKDKYGLPLA